jgi:hypothetical protein
MCVCIHAFVCVCMYEPCDTHEFDASAREGPASLAYRCALCVCVCVCMYSLMLLHVRGLLALHIGVLCVCVYVCMYVEFDASAREGPASLAYRCALCVCVCMYVCRV